MWALRIHVTVSESLMHVTAFTKSWRGNCFAFGRRFRVSFSLHMPLMRRTRYHHSPASPHERPDEAVEPESLKHRLLELETNPKPPAHRKRYELYVQALKFFADEDAQSRDSTSTDDGSYPPTPNDSAVTAISQLLCEQTSPQSRNKPKRKLDRLVEDDRRIHDQPRALRSSAISEFWQLDTSGVAEEAKKRPRFR